MNPIELRFFVFVLLIAVFVYFCWFAVKEYLKVLKARTKRDHDKNIESFRNALESDLKKDKKVKVNGKYR